MKNKEINILELFSGIGGFSKGFEEAGYSLKNHYFSEVDKHAIANYKYNFPNAKHLGSVTNVYGRNLSNIDVITFGSPCQDFSLAGKQLGMEGERSVLILEAIRIIRECRPSVFIWENVKGVFSSKNGADFWAVLAAFANIGGYRLEWQLLNTSWFLPQNRERIYLIGHSANGSECGVFPITESNARVNERTIKTPIVRTLTAGGKSGGHHSSMTLIRQINDKKDFGGTSTKQQNIVYASDGIMATLSSSRTESKTNISIVNRGHGYFKGSESELNCPTLNAKSSRDNLTVHIKQIKQSKESGGKQPYQQNRVYDAKGIIPTLMKEKSDLIIKAVLTPGRTEKRQNGRRFKEDGEPAFTLGCQDQHGVMINNNIRRLSEIECERLQGFDNSWKDGSEPANWTKYGNYDGVIKEIPKTQRYKMCGNAVTVDVVKCIASRIKLLARV